MEKIGLGAKQGKTRLAIEQVVENLLRGNKVVYLNHELSDNTIKERLYKESEDVLLTELFVFRGSIEEAVASFPEDVVIVSDIGKDVSYIDCKNPLYVYYQTPLSN